MASQQRSPDHEWAEAEFAAIAEGIGSVHDHIRALYDNWTEGRAVQRFYPGDWGVPQVFADRYPGAMSRSNVKYIGQTHRLRRLLGGHNVATYDVVTDGVLRTFGDPDKWEPEKARAVFEKAQDIARERIAKMHRTRLPVGVADGADPTGTGGTRARRRDRRGAGPGLGEGRDRAPGGRRDSEGINGAVGGPRARRR